MLIVATVSKEPELLLFLMWRPDDHHSYARDRVFLLLQDHPSQLRYKHNAFLEDLKKLYELTGVKNQKLTFLFSEAWTGDWI